MEKELFNPGMQLLYTAWALVFLIMGIVFVAIFPHPLMIVFGFPLTAAIAIVFVWEGFFRTPNRIRVTMEGLELGFRTRKPRQIPWQDVLKVEIPASDPTTFFGRNLSLAKLHVKGEKSPFYIHIFPAMRILEAKGEAEKSSGHRSHLNNQSDSIQGGGVDVERPAG